MGIIFGLTAAICWGVADYIARLASQRVGSYRTSYFLQIIGFGVMTLYLALTGGLVHFPHGIGWQPWILAAVAGGLNAYCGVALYHSLEIGVIAVVAPIASSYSALTVVLSVMSGEHFTAQRGLGIAAIIVGVVLAASSTAPATTGTGGPHPGHPQHVLSRGVGWALSASLGYGVLFWMLGYHVIPALGGMLTVWLTRLTTFLALTLAAIPAGQTLRWPRGSVWWLLVAIGLTDTAAFVANNLGLNTGHIGVVTVLASLFSAVTVLLGWLLLRERLQRSQGLGVLLIFTGIVLVSL